MEKIKMILADDEVLFRKGIAFLLQRESNIEILFEASDGLELTTYLEENKEQHPDIILMDLKMPLLNGVEATKIIHDAYPEIKIIALTSYNTRSFVANMIHVGASSYLVKNATPAEMLLTINEVFEKGFYYNDCVLDVINEGIAIKDYRIKSHFDEDYLTTREKEVLEFICQQFSTNEIAEKLFISPRTVDGHRNNLLLKTESKNIAGLVVYAIQNKVIPIEDILKRI
ncbi:MULTISPECIES: response regulator transcription factor [Flavobacterium]|uniref:Response regulator n=1 Tax=Flavobacterium jumunjinense TaxID=998845 RepID=A0ABV5GU13_9FLAO|nr:MULTISPECIES: response regulator transcription factor [Flavobacterium]